MPTKHKRKRDSDKSNFNLPPTTRARPLPVIAPSKDFLAPRKRKGVDDDDNRSGAVKKKRKTKSTDDTPKAFARLMAWHQEGRKLGGGLDDGRRVGREGKKGMGKGKKMPEAAAVAGTEGADAGTAKDVKTKTNSTSQPDKSSAPKIQPGETLQEFSLRVDQSLPLSSLPRSNVNPTTLPADLREKEKQLKKLTKHNKRLARMQSEWRNTEAKLRAKEEEELEDMEEKLEEEKLMWGDVKGTRRKKGKVKSRSRNEEGEVEGDPWKVLERKRREEERERKKVVEGGGERGRGRAVPGLSARDQVQAPPEFTVRKLNPFKVKVDVEGDGKEVRGESSRGQKQGRREDGTWVRKRDELDEVRRRHIEAAKRRSGVPV